jgi:hypothetical protein
MCPRAFLSSICGGTCETRSQPKAQHVSREKKIIMKYVYKKAYNNTVFFFLCHFTVCIRRETKNLQEDEDLCGCLLAYQFSVGSNRAIQGIVRMLRERENARFPAEVGQPVSLGLLQKY